jgi:hypothetical protein
MMMRLFLMMKRQSSYNGVITAATIKYALNIHAAIQDDLLNSFMILGIAGKA